MLERVYLIQCHDAVGVDADGKIHRALGIGLAVGTHATFHDACLIHVKENGLASRHINQAGIHTLLAHAQRVSNGAGAVCAVRAGEVAREIRSRVGRKVGFVHGQRRLGNGDDLLAFAQGRSNRNRGAVVIELQRVANVDSLARRIKVEVFHVERQCHQARQCYAFAGIRIGGRIMHHRTELIQRDFAGARVHTDREYQIATGRAAFHHAACRHRQNHMLLRQAVDQPAVGVCRNAQGVDLRIRRRRAIRAKLNKSERARKRRRGIVCKRAFVHDQLGHISLPIRRDDRAVVFHRHRHVAVGACSAVRNGDPDIE